MAFVEGECGLNPPVSLIFLSVGLLTFELNGQSLGMPRAPSRRCTPNDGENTRWLATLITTAYVRQLYHLSDIGVCAMAKQSDVHSPTVKSSSTLRDLNTTRLNAVMEAAAQSGLLGEKSKRIGGRISPALLEQAKKHTGITTDTDLIEFALANVALEDNFDSTFRETRGMIDPDLKLGF